MKKAISILIFIIFSSSNLCIARYTIVILNGDFEQWFSDTILYDWNSDAVIEKNIDPVYLRPGSSSSVHIKIPIGHSLPSGISQLIDNEVFDELYTFHCYVYDNDDSAFCQLIAVVEGFYSYSSLSTGIGWEVLYVSFFGPSAPVFDFYIYITVATSDTTKENHIYCDNAELNKGGFNEFQFFILVFPIIIVLITAIQIRKSREDFL